MRLLDVIELREQAALRMKTSDTLEMYRALDKEKNELIDALADGQAKTHTVKLGAITITSGVDAKDLAEAINTYSTKVGKTSIETSADEIILKVDEQPKGTIEDTQTESNNIHADFIKSGVLSHQEEIKKEADFKAENERMYNEIKKLGEVHARVYKGDNLVNAIVDELEEMNKRVTALEEQVQKQSKMNN